MPRYLEVAFNLPLRQHFTYLDLADAATELGVRVVAPFGRRRVTGFVVGVSLRAPPDVELRAIGRRVDAQPVFDAALLELARWVADTYLCSLGEALAAMIPGGRRETLSDDFDLDPERWRTYELTAEQRRAVAALTAHLDAAAPGSDAPAAPEQPPAAARARRFYLRGVTGSGKTAVFLEAARRTVAAGRGVIYLVPEISLTHQVVDQFGDVFGPRVAVIHSALTPSQRLQQWSRIRSGAACVVIGARSAVFAPLRDLGMIVLDEEHESSYKSSATPRYHARQVAMHRCRQEGATLVMGSATPSLEALHNMAGGRLRRLDLTQRPGRGRMPAIDVVEMKGRQGPLSARLVEEIRAATAARRQSILFLNRRGFAYFFHCRSCGFEMRCVRCSVNLTYHKATRVMLCHYCGYRAAPMRLCPECSSLDVGYSGYGTQRVEEELAAALPGLRVRRLDTDAARNRRELRTVLEQFREGAVDVLVGTQMVAKGLDFPAVRLVGIINADTGLHVPDFRAAERTFNLIVQVSGRAGRALPDGRVLVQTCLPDQDAIRLAVEGRAEEFYRREIELRRELRFPPFARLIRIVIRSRNRNRAHAAAGNFAEQLRRNRRPPPAAQTDGELLGPVECAIERIAGSYRYHVLLRHPTLGPLHAWVQRTCRAFQVPAGVHLEVDVDPTSVL